MIEEGAVNQCRVFAVYLIRENQDVLNATEVPLRIC